MTRPHLQIVVGSVRAGRMSLPVANWVADRVRAAGHWSVELVDLDTWHLPQFALAKPPAMGAYEDPRQKAWARTMARGDAYLFVCPEYNHGYSGVLKTALDYLYEEWLFKPAACVSFGNAGGARMVEALQMVFAELGMVAVAPSAHLMGAHGKRDGDAYAGNDRDEKALAKTLDFLAQWSGRVGSRPVHPAPGAPRIFVIGKGEQAIAEIATALHRNGWQAGGMVAPDDVAGLPDAKAYDLVVFGRGTLGPIADRLRPHLTAANPDLVVLETLLPFAVRQIEAQIEARGQADAGGGPGLVSARLDAAGGRLSLTITLARAGTIGLTRYAIRPAVEHQLVATIDAAAGEHRLDLALDDADALDGVLVDLDGAEFAHCPMAPDA